MNLQNQNKFNNNLCCIGKFGFDRNRFNQHAKQINRKIIINTTVYPAQNENEEFTDIIKVDEVIEPEPVDTLATDINNLEIKPKRANVKSKINLFEKSKKKLAIVPNNI